MAKAEEKLDEHLNNQPKQTPDEERNQKKEEYKDWDSRMKDLQKQQISANSELEAAKAEEEAARKALDDYIAAHGDSGGGDGDSGSDSSGEDNNSGSGSSGDSPDNHDGGQEAVRENTAQSREGQASGGSVSGNDGVQIFPCNLQKHLY